ncbi:NAD-dependent protein deacylase [Psilocybe cubensis]|uniref:NAD-dependent protein deacylase n=3 Tax=Psilocybe cubensis TaxID=181762 RepID=A0ACB8H6X7_PSICU|nr:NAD-dependent protein deacylase [Psilocybe cubensis]KAH9483745.1 NAD-dependent protein deacylase [Psilocybe cubensis]
MNNDTLQGFREAFANAKHIIVIAGAGLSAASGIPTFRDGGGMWRSLDATSLATPEAFHENPSLVWQFYHYRRQKALQAETNTAHKILAKLAIPHYLKKVAPAAKSMHLITQNVDRLSVRALDDLEKELEEQGLKGPSYRARTGSVVQMHGKLFEVQCTKCDWRAEDFSTPLCPALGHVEANIQDYTDAGSKNHDIPISLLPHCPECQELARPGVVWFGEKPYHLDQINSLVFKADMCLVIGTSSTVHPAAGYAFRVRRRHGHVAIFNLYPSEKDENASSLFRGACEDILPQVFPELADPYQALPHAPQESRTVRRGGKMFGFQCHLDGGVKDLPPIDFSLALIKCSEEYHNSTMKSYIQNAHNLTSPSQVCIVGTHRDLIVQDYGWGYLASRKQSSRATFYDGTPYLQLNCLDIDDVQVVCEYIVDTVTATPGTPTSPRSLSLSSIIFDIKHHVLDYVARVFSLPIPNNVNLDKPDDGQLDDQAVDHLLSSSYADTWREGLRTRVKSNWPTRAMPTHRISQNVIVKRNDKNERDATDYIRLHTHIPVPQIYHRNLENWTAFQFIEGEMLLECLHKKSLFMQFRIACTLRLYLTQLHSLKGFAPGRLHNPGVVSGPLFDNSARGPFHPFSSFQAWCEVVALQGWADTVAYQKTLGMPQQLPLEPPTGKPWKLNYAHGDLNFANIILSKDGVLWLVDWAESGFYPRGYDAAVLAYFEEGPSFWQRMRSFIAGSEGGLTHDRFWSFFHSGLCRRFLSDYVYGVCLGPPQVPRDT